MISIKRSTLIDQLFDFSQQGSGVIIGKPGVGKTHSLNALKGRYLDQGILCFLIRIDNLIEASDEEIQIELGLDENWTDTLKRIRISNGRKALLIFDAFDAARNENLRNQILKQIKKAKAILVEKWNIIVSVRSYDATKSNQLLQLFPSSNERTLSSQCRKLEIQELVTSEVHESIQNNSKLLKFYNESNESLKDILRIPFYLNLADFIVNNSSDIEIYDVKQYKSETQILSAFWKLKISSTYNHLIIEKVITEITHTLVRTKSLSCPKAPFLQNITVESSNAFHYLRSENIIDEISINNMRISFSHNIFFDYSVSCYCLSTDFRSVLEFIKMDSSRPFFLRPSFIYFLTQLWYDDRVNFWKAFDEFKKEDLKEIKLFDRIIFTGVISSEFDSLEDISPILKIKDNDSRIYSVQTLLQSIRFHRKRTKTADVLLLNSLSFDLAYQFLWDFSFLLDRSLTEFMQLDSFKDVLGITSRNFLSYILQLKDKSVKASADRLGAVKGVEFVCKTYETNATESKQLLSSLFNMLNEPGFEIYYFSSLAEHIKEVTLIDPDFVREVYLRIFKHQEKSNEQTFLGSSVVMNFTSNRRQDFELCNYRLIEHFPDFIQKAPSVAIQVGLEVANYYILLDINRFGEINLDIKKFNLKGFNCQFYSDYSSTWANNLSYHREAELASQIVNYFSKSIEENAPNLDALLDIYIQNAAAAYTWKVLLNFGGKFADKLSGYFFDFCTQEVFLLSRETSFEASLLIENVIRHYNIEQINLIEECIYRASESDSLSDTTSFLRKYLSHIPFEKLQRAESKELLEKEGIAEMTTPFDNNLTVEFYTPESWLENKGVDTADPVVAGFLKDIDILRRFNSDWINGTPERESYLSVFKFGSTLFDKVKELNNNANSEIFFTVLTEISNTFTIISRCFNTLTQDEFQKVEDIILYCFSFVSEIDNSIDKNASASSGYSPTPRLMAAEALSIIASKNYSKQNAEILLGATREENAIVRFLSIRHLSLMKSTDSRLYWEIIAERLKEENDPFVASTIISSIRVRPEEIDTINNIIKIAYENVRLFEWKNSFVDEFSNLLIWLYTEYGNSISGDILSKAYEREEFCRSVIFVSVDYFRTWSIHVSGTDKINKCVHLVLTYLTSIHKDLTTIETDNFNTKNESLKNCLSLIDLIIQRIYFALDSTKSLKGRISISDDDRAKIFLLILPILQKVLNVSSSFSKGGLIVGHTAHYFMKLLNSSIVFEPRNVLAMAKEVTALSIQSGYTFDSVAIREVVSLTEELLADHRILLSESVPFSNLIYILDIYSQAGWTDALELLWKLDEIFK